MYPPVKNLNDSRPLRLAKEADKAGANRLTKYPPEFVKGLRVASYKLLNQDTTMYSRLFARKPGAFIKTGKDLSRKTTCVDKKMQDLVHK